jgi:threonine dehydratase
VSELPITIDDVRSAAARLDGVIVRTPVLRSDALDEAVGAAVHLKCECLQRGGAFKLRGAYNKISSLPAAERARGIVAVSSGNHAIAVALSAKLHDTTATILVPEDAPAAKIDVVRSLGAEIVTFDRFTEDRDTLIGALVAERGLPFVPPYDDPAIMAGQGTAALELFEQVDGGLDALVVPMSGGGLMAGCATVAASVSPSTRMIGVEPATMDDTRRSVASGSRVTIPMSTTIADGLTVTSPGALTFPVTQALVDDVVTVTDDELVGAMRFLFEHAHLVTEPSGVAGVAALLTGAAAVESGARVGVIVSGGNVGLSRFMELVT